METFRRSRLKTTLAPAITVVMLCGICWLCSTGAPANAQGYSKVNDPNLQHFYMGRQEIEVLDNTPIVRYRNSPAGDSAQTGAAGVPGPQPLPPAGFQQYSSNVHGGPTNLPKVENGVPRKAPVPPVPSALKGNAARLKTKSSAQATQAGTKKSAPSASPVVETYKQMYQTRPQPNAPPAESGLNSTQKVHGKLLPFATTRKRANY